MSAHGSLSALLSAASWPLDGGRGDLERALRRARDARFVLIGESTHGTHEFQRLRTHLTRALIVEHGFRGVAVDADALAAARVDRYVAGLGEVHKAGAALSGFARFPRWPWLNPEVASFVAWLRAWNAGRPLGDAVGFHGLDGHDLHGSRAEVLAALRAADPAGERRARARFSSLGFAEDDGAVEPLALPPSRARELVRELVGGRRARLEDLVRTAHGDPRAGAAAQRVAGLAASAEGCYAALVGEPDPPYGAWNAWSIHLADALAALERDLAPGTKLVVWTHNLHAGDARASAVGRRGARSLAEILRARGAGEVVSLGCSTAGGSVTAAADWGEPETPVELQPAAAGSWERLLEALGAWNVYVDLANESLRRASAQQPLLERAIGAVYRPAEECARHHFESDLPRRFDGLFHFARSSASPALPQ